MLQSVLTGLGRLEGPKNVLLMSEGFISEETWPDVQDAVGGAARANTRIYTLDARGLGRGMASVESVAPTEGISRMFEQMDMGADSINSLAVDTGGFVVRNTNQFDKAIAQIADDAGNYYVLGYLPPSPADGKFHRIGVKVKRAGRERPRAPRVHRDAEAASRRDRRRPQQPDSPAVSAFGASGLAGPMLHRRPAEAGRRPIRPSRSRHAAETAIQPSVDGRRRRRSAPRPPRLLGNARCGPMPPSTSTCCCRIHRPIARRPPAGKRISAATWRPRARR